MLRLLKYYRSANFFFFFCIKDTTKDAQQQVSGLGGYFYTRPQRDDTGIMAANQIQHAHVGTAVRQLQSVFRVVTQTRSRLR